MKEWSSDLRGAYNVEDDAIFLQGMLEGMTNIEAEAYSQLRQMGASKLRKARQSSFYSLLQFTGSMHRVTECSP